MQYKKSLLKSALFIIEICLLISIFYVIKEFRYQIKIADNLKNMQNNLGNTILSLTNLLSKASGNLDIISEDNKINIKPVLSYTNNKKIHRLEFTLLNPNYSLIDCNGELLPNNAYPVRINLIWQPMMHVEDQYELICEKQTNFNRNTKTNNIYKKVLLQNINTVKFKFLEYTDLGTMRSIDLKSQPYISIHAVQIGMLIQSSEHFYSKIRHGLYNIFNEEVTTLDNFMHKVIYITTQSNLT